jgi:hypothetical protein
MPGLEGTIHTPVGTVQKKTALMLGAGVAAVTGIIWYRQKKLAESTPTVPEAEINPATGYPYGSPEDAAALAQQNSYVSPPANPGGGSNVPQSNVGYTSNGQWTQAAIETMTANGSISDPAALSAALGKYITGAYVAADDANTNNLIQQAIATVGYPPISGPSGYPPSINRTPPSGTPAQQNNVTVVTGLRVSKTAKNSITTTWAYSGQKPDYQVAYVNGVPVHNLYGTYTTYAFTGLKPSTTYNLQIRGFKNEVPGTPALVKGTTTK